MERPFTLEDIKPKQETSNDSFIRTLRQSYATPKQPTYTKGGFFDSVLNSKDYYSSTFSGATLYDTHKKLNDGTWIPKYETYSVNRDNEKYYADNQTTGDKWSNGLTKFAGKTGTAILGGTLGVVYGVKEWVTSGNLSAVYDNDISRYLDDWNVEMDIYRPNYYTEEEKDMGFFESATTSANFWANDFLGGLSFTVGAVGSEIIWGAATGGGSVLPRLAAKFAMNSSAKKLAKQMVKQSAKKESVEGVAREGIESFSFPLVGTDIRQAVSLADKVGSLGKAGRFALTSSGYEAGVEALQFKKEAQDNFYEDFRAKNGRAPEDYEIQEFYEKLNTAANGLYGYNQVLVGFSNVLMIGSAFNIKNPLSSPSKWVNKKVFGVGLDRTTNTVVKATRGQKITQKTYNILSPMFTEGVVEEGGQAVGSGTAQTWIEASYDPKYTKNSISLGDAFLDAIDETYTTKEGWKEIGLGALIGAFSSGGTSVYNRARGRKSESNFETIEREATEMMNFNRDYSPIQMVNMFMYANRSQKANKDSEVAEEQGNFTLSEKARRDASIAQLAYAYNLDHFSEAVDDTLVALNSLDAQKLAEERGISLEEAQAEKDRVIEDYKTTAKEFKLNRDFAESFFGETLKREGLNYTQTTALKDAVAYELTQGSKSWEFSRDILSAIQDEIKNVVGGEQAMKLIDVVNNATPQVQKELNEVAQQLTEVESKLKETEEKRKNVSLIKTNDIEVNRERANTANNLAIELARLTEQKQDLTNRFNVLKEAGKLNNPFSNEASSFISAEEILNLNQTIENIKTLTENNPKLKSLFQEYSRVSNDLKRYSELNKQLRDPKLQASGAKGLGRLLLGESRKINEITEKFIEGLQPAMNQASEMKAVSYINNLIRDEVETIRQAEEVVAQQPQTNNETLSPLQQIIQNHREYFSRQGIETEEQLNEAFPTQEELDEFETLATKSKYDENFSEYDEVENLESNALTEAEQIRFNELYDKFDNWKLYGTFENDGISISDIFEMQIQNQTTPKESKTEVNNDEFSDMVGESSSKGAKSRQENLSQTPDGVQFRSNRGTYTIHNITLQGLLANIGSNDIVIIEEDGEYQALPQAVSNDVGTKVRVNYGDQHIILTVTEGGAIAIENEVEFLANSNYVPNTYSGQKPYSYSFLYFKDSGEMVSSDFNEEGVYNTEAIYDLKDGDVVFFKVDLDNAYNQSLAGQNEETIEKQLKIYIVDQNGNIIGDLKANQNVFGSEGFNLIRKEAFNLYKAGQSGILSITSTVNKVFLGTPKFTLNEEGYPINKNFNTDAILDWGYYDGKGFKLRNGVGEVRTTFVSQIKRNVPVVVFRIGNQNVAFPVNLKGMQAQDKISLLDILNDQSQPISKQVIKINEILLSKGLPGQFFYMGNQNQNIFKNVETQELSDAFITAQESLDNQPTPPNMLDLDINGVAENVLSPIDFSNNPLSSPRISFSLSNLGSNVISREEVREVNPTTQEVEVKPNPAKVTQEASKEVKKVIKQPVKSTNSVEQQKADIERRSGESIKDFIVRLFENNYLVEVNGKQLFSLTQGRWGVVVNVRGVKIPFYQSTSGTDTKTAGQWYPFFGDQGNWVIKGNSDDSNVGYGFKAIQDIQSFLNKNIKEKDAIATSSLISSEVLQNQSSLRRLGEDKIKGNKKISLNKEATAKRLSELMGYTLEEGRKTKSDAELFALASKKVFSELDALNNQTASQQPSSKITVKDRGNDVSYSVKPFDQNDTGTIQEIRNILERGDTVFPKGSSGVYEYNGTSLILLRGNGVSTISDFSKLGRGLEIYKSKFNASKIQDKKEVIEADPDLINRAKKQQNKKC